MKIKSIIVDHEKHGRENLAGILEQYCPEAELLGEAASVESAIALINEYSPDQPQNPRIGLPTGDRIEFIEVSKIIRCQGEGNYTHFFFEENKHLLVAKTLVEFEDLLQGHSFIRVHKTHLVNLKHIVAWLKTDGGVLQFSNSDKVAVSRSGKDEVQ